MADGAIQLKDILITTLANNHPEIPNRLSHKEFSACRRFLSYFIEDKNGGKIYTLNYDLLLYWAMMHSLEDDFNHIELYANDGFGRDEGTEPEYVNWMGEQNFG